MQVRYYTKRDFGHREKRLETRIEYNARFGQRTDARVSVPPVVSHVWEWFWALSASRQYGANGPNPISWQELDSWASRSGENPTPEEVKMLRAMDSAWIQAVNDEARQDRLRQEGMTQARRGLRG